MSQFREASAEQSQARAQVATLKREFLREVLLLHLVQGLRRGDIRVVVPPLVPGAARTPLARSWSRGGQLANTREATQQPPQPRASHPHARPQPACCLDPSLRPALSVLGGQGGAGGCG